MKRHNKRHTPQLNYRLKCTVRSLLIFVVEEKEALQMLHWSHHEGVCVEVKNRQSALRCPRNDRHQCCCGQQYLHHPTVFVGNLRHHRPG